MLMSAVPIIPLVAQTSFFRHDPRPVDLPLTSATVRALRKRRSIDDAISIIRQFTAAAARRSSGLQE